MLYRNKLPVFVVSVYQLFEFLSDEELAVRRWDQRHRVPHQFNSAVV